MNGIVGKAALLLRRRLDVLASKIDHKSVIKSIYGEVEVTTGYFILLSIANLIALSGLLMNSIPVIIGAMLISPLMGPILSFGYAFVTGDKIIFQRAFKKISTSIALTLLVAAIATYISPLKDITNEIAVRTRPNLYDLVIAFLSGTAGAVAVCTRKGYITIVPGVAIATAVIPPLSVSGFGLGTGNPQILLGGIFLFFTNFVAITISTSVVFYAYGFKPSIITEEDVSSFRRRVYGLAVLLVVISIPLVYTLHTTIKTARLRVDIYNSLKKEFERERNSRLSTVNFSEKNGTLDIFVTVNTEAYLMDNEISEIERALKDDLRRDTALYVDQIIVHPRGLTELPALMVRPGQSPFKTSASVLKASREATVEIIRRLSAKVESIIAPYAVVDFSMGFSDKTSAIIANIRIKRDEPLSAYERKWLESMLSEEVAFPVALHIETEPFVQPLVFEPGETALTDDMKRQVAAVKDAAGKSAPFLVKIESFPSYSEGKTRGARNGKKRTEIVAEHIEEQYGVPRGMINSVVHEDKRAEKPAVKISIAFPAGDER